MSIEPFGSEEFQAKIVALWPGQDRPDGTMETIKALFDEVGEEIADAIDWYMESPEELLSMKNQYQNQWGGNWSHWMAMSIIIEYDQYAKSQHLLKPNNGRYDGGI